MNSDSTNVIRVTSWRHSNQVSILFAAMRYGVKGFATDMVHINGVEVTNVVAIDEFGRRSGKMLDQDGVDHGLVGPGVQIPGRGNIIELVRAQHLMLDNFDVVGWDFVVDKNESSVYLEYNVQWPGTVYYQYACWLLAGKRTEDFLSFLKDERFAVNWVPYYMYI